MSDSWVALSRQQREREAHRRRLPMPSKAQRHVNALAWCEDTVREKRATIGITGARPAAGVRHLDLDGQAAGDHEQMRVYRRCAVVGDSVDPLFLPCPSLVIFSLAGVVSARAAAIIVRVA